MAHRVTYADLRFMQSPPEEEKSQTAGSDGDLTYENVREAQIREEAKAARGDSPESPGLVRWSWSRVRSRRAVWVAVLGACCLVLLASAAGLGIRYWQVSEQLHQAALRRAEERLVLTERIHTCEWHLDEARGGLGSSRQSLAELWADRNRTARRLQESEAELNRSRSSLALLRQEKEQVEVALRQATACQEMVCCPRGWELFQQKCLWVSLGFKTWEKSREDCEKKGSQLVILEKSQEVRVLWNTLMAKDEIFMPWSNLWIGLVQKGRNSYAWFWLDGSSYMGSLCNLENNSEKAWLNPKLKDKIGRLVAIFQNPNRENNPHKGAESNPHKGAHDEAVPSKAKAKFAAWLSVSSRFKLAGG